MGFIRLIFASVFTEIYVRKLSYFTRSEQKALQNGFEVIYDENAYNGRYFVKNGKKWIHNIDALKRQLGTSSDSEVEEKGYDVEAYYSCH